jgi:hypothetical protein
MRPISQTWMQDIDSERNAIANGVMFGKADGGGGAIRNGLRKAILVPENQGIGGVAGNFDLVDIHSLSIGGIHRA